MKIHETWDRRMDFENGEYPLGICYIASEHGSFEMIYLPTKNDDVQ